MPGNIEAILDQSASYSDNPYLGNAAWPAPVQTRTQLDVEDTMV